MATIQVRNLPDEVVRTLKVRAAKKGQSLQEFMRLWLEDVASRPSVEELIERIEREDAGISSSTDYTAILREERDAREAELARRVSREPRA